MDWAKIMRFNPKQLLKSSKARLCILLCLSFFSFASGLETLHLLIEAHTACPMHPGEVIEGSSVLPSPGELAISPLLELDEQEQHDHCFVARIWRLRKKENGMMSAKSRLISHSLSHHIFLATYQNPKLPVFILDRAPKTSPPSHFI